jgi:hypothetical protein
VNVFSPLFQFDKRFLKDGYFFGRNGNKGQKSTYRNSGQDDYTVETEKGFSA